MYLQRVEEITPNIRYCAYNLGESGTDINDLMQMKMSSTGGVQDPVLAAKIDVSIIMYHRLDSHTSWWLKVFHTCC